MERRPQHPTVDDAPIGADKGDKRPGTEGDDQGPVDVGKTQEHTPVS